MVNVCVVQLCVRVVSVPVCLPLSIQNDANILVVLLCACQCVCVCVCVGRGMPVNI